MAQDTPGVETTRRLMTTKSREPTGRLPSIDASRFGKIEPSEVVGCCLASGTAPETRAKLNRRLKALLNAGAVREALESLNARSLLRDPTTNPRLTSEGSRHFKKLLGADQKQAWAVILGQRLVAKTLGLNPDDSAHRRRVADARGLPAFVVAVGLGLPKELTSAAAVRSELIWRILRARLADIVGHGPFPLVEELDRHSRAVLLSFAGLHSGNVQQAMAVLAARCVGLDKANAEELKMALVRQALGSRPVDRSRLTFAQNVLDIAGQLATPPFDGRVAISQVYDAYGKRHADAGSLPDFKRRLVDAARKRELSLQRVDMPELIAPDVRERSQTQWDSDVVHLVVVEWR
jgi:hypothetical protein